MKSQNPINATPQISVARLNRPNTSSPHIHLDPHIHLVPNSHIHLVPRPHHQGGHCGSSPNRSCMHSPSTARTMILSNPGYTDPNTYVGMNCTRSKVRVPWR